MSWDGMGGMELRGNDATQWKDLNEFGRYLNRCGKISMTCDGI